MEQEGPSQGAWKDQEDVAAWGQEGPGEPGGPVRDKTSGPGGMLSHGARRDTIRAPEDSRRAIVTELGGTRRDTVAGWEHPRTPQPRGWVLGMAVAGRPGETCLPALCCVAVIKLLPFVMVPRGGVKQLLIKMDISEVPSPEPLDPLDFGKSHRGARSHRPEPRHRRTGSTAASTPRRWLRLWGDISMVGAAGGMLGKVLGGLRECQGLAVCLEMPWGGEGGPEGLRGGGKQREEKEKPGGNCPLKFMKPVKKQQAARAPGCCRQSGRRGCWWRHPQTWGLNPPSQGRVRPGDMVTRGASLAPPPRCRAEVVDGGTQPPAPGESPGQGHPFPSQGTPGPPSIPWKVICILELIYFSFSHIFLAPHTHATPSQLPANRFNKPQRLSLAVISNVSAGKWQSGVEVAFP